MVHGIIKWFINSVYYQLSPSCSESTVEHKTEKKQSRIKFLGKLSRSPEWRVECIMIRWNINTIAGDESSITGPVTLKSYYTIAEFSEPKSGWSFPEGAVVQVIQKDPGGQ